MITLHVVELDGVTVDEDGRLLDYPELLPELDDAFEIEWERLHRDADGTTCASVACDQPVGWCLHEPDPGEGVAGMQWRYTALVFYPDPPRPARWAARAVCEDCSADFVATGADL